MTIFLSSNRDPAIPLFHIYNLCFHSKGRKPGTNLAQKKKPPVKQIISG
jgi:hypothetical protein